MKILTLTRVMRDYRGFCFGEYHILNAYSVVEIGSCRIFSGSANSELEVTEILFKDGHKVHVKEDSTTVKNMWRDSL